MKKFLVTMLIAALFCGVLAGCKKTEEAAPEPTTESEVVSDEKPEPVAEEETKDGMQRSYLTGEWIDKETAKKRPVAIMMGNTNESGVLPQHGISFADIIYEVPVEGEATRLMPIFQDYAKVEKVEPIRSCRLYFLEFASEFDAIYSHWGEVVYAEEMLSTYNHLDGKSNELSGLTFFRDDDKSAPHNGYTTGEALIKGIEKLGYPVDHADGYEGHYKFAEDDAPVNLEDGTDAVVVEAGYNLNKPWFVYNAEDGLYHRYQYKQEHTDAINGEQAAVKNVILQNTECYDADENGYLGFHTVGSGTGLYVTNGKAIPVTWKKDAVTSATHYYNQAGDEITLNQGKTWVCIIKQKYSEKVTCYASEADFEAAKAGN